MKCNKVAINTEPGFHDRISSKHKEENMRWLWRNVVWMRFKCLQRRVHQPYGARFINLSLYEVDPIKVLSYFSRTRNEIFQGFVGESRPIAEQRRIRESGHGSSTTRAHQELSRAMYQSSRASSNALTRKKYLNQSSTSPRKLHSLSASPKAPAQSQFLHFPQAPSEHKTTLSRQKPTHSCSVVWDNGRGPKSFDIVQ